MLSLQDRIEENVAAMSNARMAYAMLGDGLRRLFSLDAIVGLANRINFVDRADRLTFAEAQIARLAALNGVPVSYTGLGFTRRDLTFLPMTFIRCLRPSAYRIRGKC